MSYRLAAYALALISALFIAESGEANAFGGGGGGGCCNSEFQLTLDQLAEDQKEEGVKLYNRLLDSTDAELSALNALGESVCESFQCVNITSENALRILSDAKAGKANRITFWLTIFGIVATLLAAAIGIQFWGRRRT